ncbi:cyclopropane-fatty-acyl-phospholipid synthase family protein [Conexibacter sp. SYSU D00693]|uniref:SAM-dependent methyltransferase n=1 Tax=Conexibacter sp. SYSU D00693 TaxID=2812560 RepID=UPI00196B34B3|nr:cyclopropane-fatty-acyl-phospholipid synthase family protein [Conexibacter sp. SYSU D00693]
MARSATRSFTAELARALPDRPFAVELWDGTRLDPTTGDGGGPVFRLRGPDALAHVLRAPGQLGVGRAYVSGALEVDDLDAVLELLNGWKPAPIDGREQLRLGALAARAVGLRRPPRRPVSELRPRGRRHSVERDARAVRHHYDVSNDFFALFLDASMTYSCAVFSRGATTLEEAQHAKREMVCTKLGLQPGERVLDVGCGWGSFAIHAAREHGARVVGITLSEPQARLARERVAQAGVGDRVEIRVMDYRAIDDGPFDVIASIGMVEHVGNVQIDAYAQQLHRLLRPGGRLLNHGIARLRHTDPEAGPFSERYVFPDAAPLHLSRVLHALERAGFEPHHVEDLRHDYAQTLSHWIANLDGRLDEAVQLAGAERVRVWRLYLRAARNGFRSGFTSIFQVRASRP